MAKEQHKYYFRVNDLQRDKIDKKIKKSGLTQSEFFRRSALGKEIRVVDGLMEMSKELRAIGNNLNQITKAMHKGEITHVCLEELAEAHNKIYDEFYRLVKGK